MLVGVCDFPGKYAFPPHGYGGIERWLWAVAVGARAAGAEVHLLGPQWRTDLGEDWTLRPIRLEEVRPRDPQAARLRDTGYDLLVVGHEYPSLSAWRDVWQTLDCDVATFQHWPYFEHQPGAFDGVRSRLYCYSHEMSARYAAHLPTVELAVHLGWDEADSPSGEIRTHRSAGRCCGVRRHRWGWCRLIIEEAPPAHDADDVRKQLDKGNLESLAELGPGVPAR